MKYQLKKEKKAEENINNIKAVRHLYGTAHILKVEVMKRLSNQSKHKFFFCKGGEDRRGAVRSVWICSVTVLCG